MTAPPFDLEETRQGVASLTLVSYHKSNVSSPEIFLSRKFQGIRRFALHVATIAKTLRGKISLNGSLTIGREYG